MPCYLFGCEDCGRSLEVFGWIDEGPIWPDACPACGSSRLHRDFRGERAGIGAMFRAHFNNSVGQVVRSHQQFRDALRRRSDEASEATGIEHSFVPFDGEASDAGIHPDQAAEHRARRKEKVGW